MNFRFGLGEGKPVAEIAALKEAYAAAVGRRPAGPYASNPAWLRQGVYLTRGGGPGVLQHAAAGVAAVAVGAAVAAAGTKRKRAKNGFSDFRTTHSKCSPAALRSRAAPPPLTSPPIPHWFVEAEHLQEEAEAARLEAEANEARLAKQRKLARKRAEAKIKEKEAAAAATSYYELRQLQLLRAAEQAAAKKEHQRLQRYVLTICWSAAARRHSHTTSA